MTVPSSVMRSLGLPCCRASTLSMAAWSFAAHRDYQPSKAFMQEMSHQAMLMISSFDAVVSSPSTQALCRPLACCLLVSPLSMEAAGLVTRRVQTATNSLPS